MGAVTPLGNDVPSTWLGLTEGRSGVRKISLFEAGTFPTRIAGEVKNFDFPKWISRNFGSVGRHSFFALEAAHQAAEDSGFSAKTDPSRVGIYFGAGDGGFDFKRYASVLMESINGSDSVKSSLYFKNNSTQMNATELLEQEPGRVVNHLARFFGAKALVSNCLTACAASSQAIGEAAWAIRNEVADIMVTGGAHSMIHPLGVAGFNLLTALSTRNEEPEAASRPFDKTRDGFVLSEGSGALILEELEHAQNRGAKIYAELIGYGATADAFRMTDPHPKGRGAIRAMHNALKNAQMKPEEIDVINAHGTSTQLNDQIETHAVKEVFGPRAAKVPMSSIKSMLGHMIAAAGAVELITSILTIRESLVPPTINYRNPDESCDLDYVPNQARRVKVKTVLSNSFGFGGQNITLIVKEFK